MSVEENILSIINFSINFVTQGGNVIANQDINLNLRAGEILANVKLRQIMKTEAYIDYQSEVLEALREVETCLDNEVILRNRWNALSRAEDNLIEAYKRSIDEYRRGIGSSTNLLFTQRQMLSVSSQVLEIRRMRLENRINLHLTLGGNIKSKQ